MGIRVILDESIKEDSITVYYTKFKTKTKVIKKWTKYSTEEATEFISGLICVFFIEKQYKIVPYKDKSEPFSIKSDDEYKYFLNPGDYKVINR